MTTEQKLVALCAFLPVLGDFIEDLNNNSVFRQGLKNKANLLLKEIEAVDRSVLRIDGEAKHKIYEQQINLQIAFRQWIEKEIIV